MSTLAGRLERAKDTDIRVAEYSGTQRSSLRSAESEFGMCTRGGEDPDKAEAWIGNTSEEKRGRSSRPAFSSARASNIPRASGLVDRLQVS